jgi:UDP-glucose 4-epimerase
MVAAAEAASGRAVPYEITARRPGDIATCYADPSFAAQKLAWKATRDIKQMCADHWRWQDENPRGYAT